jgi:hypothetical protein
VEVVVRLGLVELKTLFRFASGGGGPVVQYGKEPRVGFKGFLVPLGIVVLTLGAYENGVGPLRTHIRCRTVAAGWRLVVEIFLIYIYIY